MEDIIFRNLLKETLCLRLMQILSQLLIFQLRINFQLLISSQPQISFQPQMVFQLGIISHPATFAFRSALAFSTLSLVRISVIRRLKHMGIHRYMM